MANKINLGKINSIDAAIESLADIPRGISVSEDGCLRGAGWRDSENDIDLHSILEKPCAVMLPLSRGQP